MNCFRSAKVGTQRAKSIFDQPCCHPPPQHVHRPEDCAITDTSIHQSHKMAIYKGLYFCMQCGAVLRNRLVKLRNACMPPTNSGSATLRRLYAGHLPYHVDQWPSVSYRMPVNHEASNPNMHIQSLLDTSDRKVSLSGQLRQLQSVDRISSRINAVATSSQQTSEARLEGISSASSSHIPYLSPPESTVRTVVSIPDDDSYTSGSD